MKDAKTEPVPDVPESARPIAEVRWRRRVLLVLGSTFVAIGAIGIVLPGLPGTVFLILAAACFARSSPRFEAWLLEHPRLGPPVRQWRKTGAIPRPVKWIACLSMAASWLILIATGGPLYLTAAIGVVFLAAAGFIVTRPSGIGG